jgi:hypothetical protein
MGQGGENVVAVCLVNGRRVEIIVEQDKKNCVEVLRHVNRAEALSGLTVGQDAATLDLQSPFAITAFLDCVIACLTGGSEFKIEDVCRFVLGNFAGNVERLTGQAPISLRQDLGVAKYGHDFRGSISIHAIMLI